MLRIILLVVAVTAAFVKPPCAYWCEAPCTIKHASFYCCSYEPSLSGPKNLLPPPCTDLCANRTGNAASPSRKCNNDKFNQLRRSGSFKICRNFKDCSATMHDLCCPDNCLHENQKMCIKL